jgi:hypothetical protein
MNNKLYRKDAIKKLYNRFYDEIESTTVYFDYKDDNDSYRDDEDYHLIPDLLEDFLDDLHDLSNKELCEKYNKEIKSSSPIKKIVNDPSTFLKDKTHIIIRRIRYKISQVLNINKTPEKLSDDFIAMFWADFKPSKPTNAQCLYQKLSDEQIKNIYQNQKNESNIKYK